MIYIVATLIRKAFEKQEILTADEMSIEEIWMHLMLFPEDYAEKAIFCEKTREIMEKIIFEHGGEEYDNLYPEGIPTSV
jgi:hypothetical protein